MNPYNFIFIYFHRFWGKRGSDGRIMGCVHVLFPLFIHISLINELILQFTGVSVITYRDFQGLGNAKLAYFLAGIPLTVVLMFLYTKKVIRRLSKKFDEKYKDAKAKNAIKIIMLIIVPTILLIALATLGQRQII